MDDIDRDQEFNERHLEAMIARARSDNRYPPSLTYCRLCGDSIPEKRRKALPGVTLCIDCKAENERKSRS